jgi:salicylate hydroxylase
VSAGRSEFLVLGAGIGGLAAALALAQGGHEVRVLEQAPELGEVGAGLQVGPNASRALDQLGILEAVARTGFFPKRLMLRDALTAEPITALATGDPFADRFGYRYFVAHRADLHQALQDACRATGRVELLAGKAATGFTSGADATMVTCADGSQYVAEALIGADGLHSLVRRTLLGDQPPEDSGYVAYRGTVPMETFHARGGLGEPDAMVIWVGPSLHLVQYPVRRGELCNQVATFDTRRYSAGAPDISRQLDLAFAGTCEQVATGVALVGRARRWPMLDRPPAAGWSQGRVTLVGDAAHPMLQYLAQGACQAIEDAVVLADCAADRPGDPAAAFAQFEELRRPRTDRVQATARKWGDVLHIDGVGAAMRAKLLAQRAPDDFEQVQWLYGYDATTAASAVSAAAATA